MGKIQTVSDNFYRKVPTGVDFTRSTGVLKDTFYLVTANQASTRYMSTGFIYAAGTKALEVYVNGVLKTVNTYVNGVLQGDYTETSSTQVRFNLGVISQTDEVRFRVTTAYYRETYTLEAELNVSDTTTVKTRIQPGDWVVDGSNYYGSIDISATISSTRSEVYCIDIATMKKIIPLDIHHPDTTQVKVYMPDATMDMYVVVIG